MARGARSGSAVGGGRLDTGLLLVCLVVATSVLVMPRRFRDAFADVLRTTVLAPLVILEARAAGVRSAISSRNDVLTVRGHDAVDALDARGVADENATLRRLLGLAARLKDGFVVAELLLRRGVDDDFTIALNVGANAGIQRFAPVVTADGLVGMVEHVDANTSFAMTWAHPDFAVSAISTDERAIGIVKPHLGTGVQRLLLELRGVKFAAKLDSGALIVSSGLGPTYPRGIAIGRVLGEISTPEKWARTYLLMPAVLPAAIGPVIVLRPERVSAGVNSVWTHVASADSAARAMAAAGDSLARKAALAELAARRAALDSAFADSVARDSLRGAPPTVLAPGASRAPLTRADSVKAEVSRRLRADSARMKPTIGMPTVPPRTGPPPLHFER